jgi:predicted tellurium resistance membrane protein TerC
MPLSGPVRATGPGGRSRPERRWGRARDPGAPATRGGTVMGILELLTSPEAWVSLLTLTALEIVLGIDNIVFITILSAKVPGEQRYLAMRLGILGALVTRILLLASLSWMMHLATPLFHVFGHPVSGRDLILVGGGLFLMGKAVFEIYEKVEIPSRDDWKGGDATRAGLISVIVQIMILDIVFSLDSVITAVGMVDQLAIMITAIVIAMMVILFFAKPVANFVDRHPSIRILALAFLVLIGVLLVAEGTGRHLDRGYVYFAMAFSLGIELLNMRYRARAQPPEEPAGPKAANG